MGLTTLGTKIPDSPWPFLFYLPFVGFLQNSLVLRDPHLFSGANPSEPPSGEHQLIFEEDLFLLFPDKNTLNLLI